jgi:hypothetical protein
MQFALDELIREDLDPRVIVDALDGGTNFPDPYGAPAMDGLLRH